MKRVSTPTLLLLILFTTPLNGNMVHPISFEENNSPVQHRQVHAKNLHHPHPPGVILSLEEEYTGSKTTSQGTPMGGSPPAPWLQPLTRPIDYPLFYAGSLIFLLILLLVVTDIYLRFRISASLPLIPWEGIRTDPRVARWPSVNLFTKLRLWGYFKDLPHVKKILESRQQKHFIQRRPAANLSMNRRYLDHLKKVRCSGEAGFLLGVISVIGNANAVGPIMNLLRRFPDDMEMVESAAATLFNIRDPRILPSLLPYIPEADPVLYEILVEVFKSFGNTGIDMVLKELDHQNNSSTRIGILRILGDTGGESVVPVVEKYMLQGTKKERMEAVRALARIGTEGTVEPLIHGLCQIPSSEIRECIAQSLTGIPTDLALDALSQIVETSPTDYFRIRAIEGLEALRPDPCPVLHQAIQDPHPKIRAAAAHALERIGIVQKELERYWDEYNEETQRFLINVGKAGAEETFYSALENEESKVVKRTVRLLARIGNRNAIPYIRKLLDTSEDWTVRSRSIQALGDLRTTEAIPVIIEHIKEKYHWVRKISIDALGKLLSPDSSLRHKTLPIFHQALTDENPWTRASAIRVLTNLEDRSSIPMFMELLHDPQTRVRAEAVRGLKWLHATESQEELIHIMDDPRQKVCAMAASALGEFRNRKALYKLFERFKSAKPLLRVAILEAVYQIDPTELEPLLRVLKTTDKNNIKVVREINKIISFNPAPILLTLAKSGETEIKCQAIRSLQGQQGEEIEEFLVSMMKDRDATIRAASVDAIVLNTNPYIGHILHDMLNDPDLTVRLRVILALGLIKNPETLPFLRNALYEDDHRIRAHAIMTLFHYAEPRFLELFLEQFKNIKVRNLLKKMILDRKDPVIPHLIERIPTFKEPEFQILKNHTLKSLDISLEEQMLFGKTKEEKLRAIMIAEILKRKKLKNAFKKTIQGDPHAEIRARALRAYSSITDITKEKEIVQQAILDPALEVQTMASRMLILLEEEEIV